MFINFFNYIIAMLIAGLGSFGGGPGGVNIIKEYAINLIGEPEMKGEMLTEILNITSLSQLGGYSQGMTLAAYLGTKTGLGFLGSILGVIAFFLPSILIVVILLKIGEKLYKNIVFKYSVKYMNLFAAGLLCMILWNYIATVFGSDPIIYVAVAGLACFFHVYFNIHPAIIIACGGIIGIIWRA